MSFFVHPTSLVDGSSKIGDRTKIWHFCHIMDHCSLGEDCVLGQNVFIASGVQLGRNVHVQNNVSLYSGVSCEDDVFIGPSVVFTNIRNPRSAISRKDSYLPTYIERGATIGANATIICGNRIGRYALIGAGAVVTRAVLPYSLILGNPGRHKGWVSEFGHTLSFNSDGMAICPESSVKYILQDGQIRKLND